MANLIWETRESGDIYLSEQVIKSVTQIKRINYIQRFFPAKKVKNQLPPPSFTSPNGLVIGEQ